MPLCVVVSERPRSKFNTWKQSWLVSVCECKTCQCMQISGAEVCVNPLRRCDEKSALKVDGGRARQNRAGQMSTNVITGIPTMATAAPLLCDWHHHDYPLGKVERDSNLTQAELHKQQLKCLSNFPCITQENVSLMTPSLQQTA